MWNGKEEQLMFNKLLVLSGLLVLFFIPSTMKYEKSSTAVVSNFSTGANLIVNTKKPQPVGIKIPTITPTVTINKNFYKEETLGITTHNVLLITSSFLTIAGIALAEFDAYAYLIKSRTRINKDFLFEFIKRL
jgi:hypothetical protein